MDSILTCLFDALNDASADEEFEKYTNGKDDEFHKKHIEPLWEVDKKLYETMFDDYADAMGREREIGFYVGFDAARRLLIGEKGI